MFYFCTLPTRSNFYGNIKRLTDKLDEKFPRRSAEDWLAKNFTEAQNQTMTLQNVDAGLNNQTALLQSIGTDVGNQTKTLQNIGEQVSAAIHAALDESLNEYVDKILRGD